MSKPQPLMGVYTGLQTAAKAMNLGGATTATLNADQLASLLMHLDEASRAFERETNRYFFPYVTTYQFRWPPLVPGATWTCWTSDADDILAVITLTVAATGINTIPVVLTHFFLEPSWGPPYHSIQVDLSSQDVYQSGSTPQRSISVLGQWGFCNSTKAAGTETGLTTTNATTATVSTPSLIDTGDVLLVDAEALYVAAGGGTNTLTVQRGVNGTTAVGHSDNAVVSKYAAPADVARIVMQHAISGYLEEQAAYIPQAWGRAEGAGAPVAMGGAHAGLVDKRAEVIDRYARVRTGVV